MSVTKVDQAPGGFTIQLRPLPFDVHDTLDPNTYGFGLVVITPATLQPAAFTRTNLLAASIYTGIFNFRELTDEGEKLTGYHATAALGDGDGKGDIPEVNVPTVAAAQTLDKYVGARGTTYGFRPASVGAGNINATVATRTYQSELQTPLQDLTAIHALYGDDYCFRVTDQLTLDSGTTGQVYGSARPMLTPFKDGTDPAALSVKAKFTHEQDLEAYITRVRVGLSADSDFLVASSIPFEDGRGNTLAVSRMATADSNQTLTHTALGQLCSKLITAESTIINRLTVHVEDVSIMSTIQCGQYVFCWDPANEVYLASTTLTATYFRGALTFPLGVRVLSVEMPVEAGMGVYFIDLNDRITDLTSYVVWDNPGATLEVGAFTRALGRTIRQHGIAA